ncbi:hypothetical protein [Candidatus Uabimicrobium sp. HlEnr_7]|uniref:hypothetical protein n=1 Tax=Candidatus Uabimicrobium helgolandensis TaxID=3095367 RepID=UPI003556321A
MFFLFGIYRIPFFLLHTTNQIFFTILYFSTRTRRNTYIKLLISRKSNAKKNRAYQKWLSQAISFIDSDLFYYERALLYKDTDYKKALLDLRKAFQLVPKNRYLFTQAKILSTINPKEAKNILNKIDYAICDLEDFALATRIGITIKDVDYARAMLKKYSFLHTETKEKVVIHLLSHDIYKQKEQNVEAQKHLHYAQQTKANR